MNGQDHPATEASDDALLDRLRALLAAVDPLPEQVVAAARDSYGWRTVDAELAELLADSALADAEVRGEPGRLLTFRAGAVTIEIEVSEVSQRLRLVGQVVPPARTAIRVEQPRGGASVNSDALGRFTVTDLPPGPTRLVCTSLDEEGAGAIHTDWTVL